MQKNELLKHEGTIKRILELKEDKVLAIDCMQKSMPKWMNQTDIVHGENCTEEELLQITNMTLADMETLDMASRKTAQERYTLIAGILPFIGNKKVRNQLIDKAAIENSISKQTIRAYLCRYLVYQDISVLAPKQSDRQKPLTQDEKNMRWALNKFYYTKHKNSLQTAYTMMLKARYCDKEGNLLPEYPSIHQFKYYYRKHKKLQTYYISREGIKKYQRDHRPLLGEGVRQFAPNVGTAMLDATVCDIYLINEAGQLVGRPILTACIDAYSGLCCGYTLSWEGGVYSLRNLMLNVITDKVVWCQKFGIAINQKSWNCQQLPAVLVTDMGAEYKSQNFEQLTELGVKIINLPSFRPELKGIVEKFFDLIQSLYKKQLKGKGVIEPDFQERGAHDYRKDACLTMQDFEKILLRCLIYYNSQRIIENFPYTEEMIEQNIQPYASEIWNYGLSQAGVNLICVNDTALLFTLLPRITGKFRRDGLYVNKLRYRNDAYTEQYLQGDTATVAYDPDDVSEVWVVEDGAYIPFQLIESRFRSKELSEVISVRSGQKELVRAASEANLQAQIDLAEHIEAITNTANTHTTVTTKEVRMTRNKERTRARLNGNGGA